VAEPAREFQWEMSIGREEFLRLLPGAVGHAPHRIDGELVACTGAAPGWRIRLEPMPDLCIALLRLPRHRVSLTLEGFDAAQAAAFLHRFELHYRRGGG
jgi:hypothetical protein